MPRKRKGRSVRKNKQVLSEPEDVTQAPHSFIIHRGLSGGHIIELTKDFRRVMEPYTASNLKERKKNSLKDFVSLSGVFHVSHMCIMTRTETGAYMKLGKMPRGPTLSFKVHSFTLSRDVVSSLRKQVVPADAFKSSPLVVLNNFSGEGQHIKLMATTFQNMFPTINVSNVKLSTLRRCVLLSYNPQTELVDMRHYAIKVKPIGLSKGVSKFVQGKVPNLSSCNDIADFLTKGGITSECESEVDEAAEVTMPEALSGVRGNVAGGQSAVRLTELGPRLTLQLVKVEDGLLDGEVLYHRFVEKTEEEKALIAAKREKKRKLKEKRKSQQDQNVKQKEKKKDELKKKSLDGMQKRKKTENDILMQKAARESMHNEETRPEDDDDAEYFRQEVGEEPDQDLFSQNRKRPLPYKSNVQNKKFKSDTGETSNKFNKSKNRNEDTPNKFNKFKNRNDESSNKFSKFKNKNDDVSNKFNKFKKRNDDVPNKFNKFKRGNNDSPNKFNKFKKGGKFTKDKNFGKTSGKKWPGGRGGNPKYGFQAQNNEQDNRQQKKSRS